MTLPYFYFLTYYLKNLLIFIFMCVFQVPSYSGAFATVIKSDIFHAVAMLLFSKDLLLYKISRFYID